MGEVYMIGDRVVVARPGNRYRQRFAGKTGTVTRFSENPATGRLQALTTIDDTCWFPIGELDWIESGDPA